MKDPQAIRDMIKGERGELRPWETPRPPGNAEKGKNPKPRRRGMRRR